MGFLSTFVTTARASPTCTPKNWNYAWFLVGNTWFTNIREKLTWMQALEACKKIEPGRTTLASIETKAEHDAVRKSDISGGGRYTGWTWTAGVLVPSLGKWFWYKDNGRKALFKPMHFTAWRKDEPNGDGTCLNLYEKAWGRLWNDYPCSN